MAILPVPVSYTSQSSHYRWTSSAPAFQSFRFFKRSCLVEGQVERCRRGCHRMRLQEAASQHHFSDLRSNSGWPRTRAVGCTEEERLVSIALAEAAGCCSWGCIELDRVRREVGQSTQYRTWVVDHACVGVER